MAKSTIFPLISAACDDWDVPSMSPAAACQKAATAKPMLDLCSSILGTATSPEQDVTAFVIAAVKEAGTSYGGTARYFQLLIPDTSVPAEVRSAAMTCLGRYGEAVRQLNAAVGHLKGCQLAELVADVPAALVAVDDCSTAFLRVSGSLTLYHRVIGDRDRTVLALRLTDIMLHPGN